MIQIPTCQTEDTKSSVFVVFFGVRPSCDILDDLGAMSTRKYCNLCSAQRVRTWSSVKQRRDVSVAICSSWDFERWVDSEVKNNTIKKYFYIVALYRIEPCTGLGFHPAFRVEFNILFSECSGVHEFQAAAVCRDEQIKIV